MNIQGIAAAIRTALGSIVVAFVFVGIWIKDRLSGKPIDPEDFS